MSTQSKERPIIFKPESIREILANRKTQTRRVMKPQPVCGGQLWVWERPKWTYALPGQGELSREALNIWQACPYGQPGDRLWVKEAFYVDPDLWAQGHDRQPTYYAANTDPREVEDYVLKPSMFMPRWASRLTLEIVDVRVERVQDITWEDAEAEGIEHTFPEVDRGRYQQLWDSLNAKRGTGWTVNPWVWVIGFKVMK